MIDYLSKWPEASPLYHKSAKKVAEKLADTIYRYGPPDTIISDCGGEFNSKITSQLMLNFGIKHINTAPYHPQANGLVENFNQTLQNMINKNVSDNGNDWDALLVNESSVWPVSAPAEENISDQDIEKLMAKRDVIEAQVRENIGNAQERQKYNTILNAISTSNLGAKLGNIHVGSPTCADDIALLGEGSDVQAMLGIIEILH
ncbi:unnamed protein product [Mytilus edulis]|uniref:Integrase catalytic domain-containing protein n=1 Tax=Mytilus edulis TaxID=6550 RepID=A0A8S3UGQ2_MYTED|nr:unnamed protein product [Mytilus edulis]